MKRFRDMEQLSGGEKTVAALALLFAIHRYRNIYPSIFIGKEQPSANSHRFYLIQNVIVIAQHPSLSSMKWMLPWTMPTWPRSPTISAGMQLEILLIPSLSSFPSRAPFTSAQRHWSVFAATGRRQDQRYSHSDWTADSSRSKRWILWCCKYAVYIIGSWEVKKNQFVLLLPYASSLWNHGAWIRWPCARTFLRHDVEWFWRKRYQSGQDCIWNNRCSCSVNLRWNLAVEVKSNAIYCNVVAHSLKLA